MSEGAIIMILFTIIWGVIWLIGGVWDKATEDERLDRFYEKLEKRGNNK